MSAADQVRQVVASALSDPAPTGAQVVLDAVDVTAAGKRKLVRVTLDRAPNSGPDGWTDTPTTPLSLDDIADYSRVISEALDEREPFGGQAYVLEVSSPGVGRPLREPRHYRRNVGRLLSLDVAGTSRTGRVVKASEDAVILAFAADAGAHEETVAYADISRASVEVEFASSQEKDE